jgi:hypothetical protein
VDPEWDSSDSDSSSEDEWAEEERAGPESAAERTLLAHERMRSLAIGLTAADAIRVVNRGGAQPKRWACNI